MSLYENLSDKEIQLLKDDPRVWASTFLSHPDDPERGYDFHDARQEKKLNYLLSDDGPLNPDNWGNINLFKFCRGGLKTTILTIINAWAISMYPTVNEYMAAPRSSQVREFSERLDDKLRDCGVKQRRALADDNIELKVLEATTSGEHGENIYKAKFQADSGWTEEAMRGPHSHIGNLDEFQDLNRNSFEAFLPAIDRQLPDADWAPAIFIIGTPKLEGSFYDDLWKMSDQRSWDQSNLNWDVESTREEFMPDDAVLEEMDMEVDTDDFDAYEVAGWHLDQYNSPLHTPQEIARNKATMRPLRFKTEVEAKFHSPEDDLLNRETVKQNFFDDSRGFTERRASEDSMVTMGVDWGGGADKNAAVTAVMVMEWDTFEDAETNREEKIGRVLTAKALDQENTHKEEQKHVETLINRYNVNTCVVDHGYGHASMVDLQDGNDPIDPSGYGDIVVGAKYGNVQNASDIKYETSSGKKRFFSCDKSFAIERAVEAVRNEHVVCPSADLSFGSDDDLGSMLIDHLTNPYKDHTETPSGTKKVRVQTNDGDNDDFLDALTFCVLGKKQTKQTTAVPVTASGNRF